LQPTAPPPPSGLFAKKNTDLCFHFLCITPVYVVGKNTDQAENEKSMQDHRAPCYLTKEKASSQEKKGQKKKLRGSPTEELGTASHQRR